MQWERVASEDEEGLPEATEVGHTTQNCQGFRRIALCAIAVLPIILLASALGLFRNSYSVIQIHDLQSKAEAHQGPIFGGEASKDAFNGFLAVWRDLYRESNGIVPELASESLPAAFHDVQAKVVLSGGGAAEGGIVTEGVGYAIMVEGVQAALGNKTGLRNALAFMKAWLGMVNGPQGSLHNKATKEVLQVVRPLGGGAGKEEGASTKADVPPYGVSAIPPQGSNGKGPSGVAAWKYPVDACDWGLCLGSATDADEDAIFGMIYIAAVLDFPEDFIDTVMRSVIAFASADLGFPDLYRTLQDGKKVFVPKGGSMWGGLTPNNGEFKDTVNAGCYNPSYFSPASYRLFRDFTKKHWKPSFAGYLPLHQNGQKSTMPELLEAFDGAIIAGYNLLYRSHCPSGVIANWVGAQAQCQDTSSLNCAGVPWATTPHVGAQGTCTVSGTKWGSWGKDASRGPWRVAMDYAMYPSESTKVTMYNEAGSVDPSISFNAKIYLNGLANQYVKHSHCDGGKPGDCNDDNGRTDASKLAHAFVGDLGAPGLSCEQVPIDPEPNWWAAEMAHPTFTGFIAPSGGISSVERKAWLDTFAKLCDFADMGSYDDMDTTHGAADICSKTYFQASQQVLSAMIMSGALSESQVKLKRIFID